MDQQPLNPNDRQSQPVQPEAAQPSPVKKKQSKLVIGIAIAGAAIGFAAYMGVIIIAALSK